MFPSLTKPLPTIVAELLEAGWTEAMLAKQIRASQSTVNRARRGKPVFSHVSDNLRRVHAGCYAHSAPKGPEARP